jgi:hypothetical protein
MLSQRLSFSGRGQWSETEEIETNAVTSCLDDSYLVQLKAARTVQNDSLEKQTSHSTNWTDALIWLITWTPCRGWLMIQLRCSFTDVVSIFRRACFAITNNLSYCLNDFLSLWPSFSLTLQAVAEHSVIGYCWLLVPTLMNLMISRAGQTDCRNYQKRIVAWKNLSMEYLLYLVAVRFLWVVSC